GARVPPGSCVISSACGQSGQGLSLPLQSTPLGRPSKSNLGNWLPTRGHNSALEDALAFL
ncbi:MAG TPA: hypothetical protein VJQ56_01580, partial [Blastocatellia bacterium]|nr:hypothetical protein [Blastocatellia bacterium]